MVKTIAKIANSEGLIFDAELMDLVRLKAGDQVNVEIHDDGSLTITPLRPRPTAAEVSRATQVAMRDYTRTMKRLA